jgi:CheY-like chemotaxis protein
MTVEPRVILVVDDDVATAEALSQVLARAGRHVLVAHDGEEARRLVEGGVRPCLILLDWVMPRVDGPAFLGWREGSPEVGDVPVFVTSGTHVPEHDVRIQAVLPKPIGLEDLLAAVRSTCTSHCPRLSQCPFRRA